MDNPRSKKKKPRAPLKSTRRYRTAAELVDRTSKLYATEKQVTEAVITWLRARGWWCKKTHGNQYQKGWPDWYISHPDHGPKWVELKSQRPDHKLEASQKIWFSQAERHGVGVWVMTGVADYRLLFEKPNWKDYR
jgi:hypothetical protein